MEASAQVGLSDPTSPDSTLNHLGRDGWDWPSFSRAVSGVFPVQIAAAPLTLCVDRWSFTTFLPPTRWVVYHWRKSVPCFSSWCLSFVLFGLSWSFFRSF